MGTPPLLSVGLDMEDLARWREPGLQVTGADGRVFTAAEREACLRHADPAPHFAVRWCAKEAVVKAMAPLAALRVTQIEIVTGAAGAPRVAWRDFSPPAGFQSLALSLTHSQNAVAAVAVVQYLAGENPSGQVK